MIQATGIDHLVLHVTDVQRAKKFYTEILGMKVYRENDLNHLALNVATGIYEALKADLENHGVAVTGRPGEDRCIYFQDPDGHRLQLMVR